MVKQNIMLENNEKIITDMYNQISDIITENKIKMIYQINNTLVETNFMIGKIIIENEQNGNVRAEYGKDILRKLSKKLTNEFGSGFSLSGLYNMRLFYSRYKKFQPLAGNLSWSHYCYLIYIDDDNERKFYENDASIEEQEAFRMLFTEFLEFCWENDFIGKPDWDTVMKFYDEIENKC